MSLLRVGVLGSGNFGGQVASVAANEGFPAIALNASARDLDLLHKDVIPFQIGDGKGTGKNRDYAEEFLTDHISVIEDEEFVKFITSNDVIVIAGSAGGGFGSNTVPILAQTLTEEYPDTLFIVLTTFPKQSETYTAQNYTENFMRSLITADEDGNSVPYVPYIIYDNEKCKNMTPEKMSEKILSTVIEDLCVMRGDYVLQTNTGGIDERDLLTALSVPGRLIVSKLVGVDESSLVDDSIVSTIREDITNSVNAGMVDDKLISASALMYNLNNDLLRYASNIEEDIQTEFGQHITDYRNEAITEEHEPFIVTILAGLTEPTVRIDKVIARRQSIETAVINRKAAATKLNQVSAGTLGLTPKKFGGTTTKKTSQTDLGNKYKKPEKTEQADQNK